MGESDGKLGRYELLGTLGRGAMGVVYKARDPLIDRVVAIKQVALPAVFSDQQREEFTRRFFGEAKAAGRLKHPNVVTIYDLGVEDGKPFMAMELVEGQSLSQIIKDRGALPAHEALAVARQVALGLAYAHEQGIVHRDIKPDNILLDRSGRAVITDFGVAHLEASDLTRTGEVLGTPHFMSPEQVKGEPLDGRSDLFSLGVVLFEMLTGQRPFRGDTISSICYQIVHAPPRPDLSQLDVPLPAGQVLAGLLAKEREARYADGNAAAAAMADALSRLGGDETRAMAPLPRSDTSARNVPGSGARTLPGSGVRTLPDPAARTATGMGAAPTVVSPPHVRPPAAPPARSGPSKAFVALLAVLGLLLVLFVLGGVLKGVRQRKAASLAASEAKAAAQRPAEPPQAQLSPEPPPPASVQDPPKMAPSAATSSPVVAKPAPQAAPPQPAKTPAPVLVPVTVELTGPILGGGYGIFVDGEMKRQATIHGTPDGLEGSKPGFQVTETLELPPGTHTLRFGVKPAFGGTALVKDWTVVLEEGHPLSLSVFAHPRKAELFIKEGGREAGGRRPPKP